MDCEKLETEQEVFGFFVADLQKECKPNDTYNPP